MTTPEGPVFTDPVTSRESRSSARGYLGTALLEEAYSSPEAVSLTLQYEPSLPQGIFSNTIRNHWEALADYQTGPVSSIYTAMPEDDIRSYLASTANDTTRTSALSRQVYPIATGAGHHQLRQIADSSLSAHRWPPTPSVYLDAAM
jgi:hypothetical protein